MENFEEFIENLKAIDNEHFQDQPTEDDVVIEITEQTMLADESLIIRFNLEPDEKSKKLLGMLITLTRQKSQIPIKGPEGQYIMALLQDILAFKDLDPLTKLWCAMWLGHSLGEIAQLDFPEEEPT